MDTIESKMEKSLQTVKNNMAAVRTGRASPDLLKRIQVDFYGSMVPIKQLASISIPEPKMLAVHVFDRSAVTSVEKAIQKSDLGLNPNTEGNLIRLNLPDLTQERRKDLEKVVRRIAEEGKVAVRNLRRESLDEFKKKESLSDDEKHREQDKIQKATDKFVSKIDEILAQKEKDLQEI